MVSINMLYRTCDSMIKEDGKNRRFDQPVFLDSDRVMIGLRLSV